MKHAALAHFVTLASESSMIQSIIYTNVILMHQSCVMLHILCFRFAHLNQKEKKTFAELSQAPIINISIELRLDLMNEISYYSCMEKTSVFDNVFTVVVVHLGNGKMLLVTC